MEVVNVSVAVSEWVLVPALAGGVGLFAAFVVALFGEEWKWGGIIAALALALLVLGGWVDEHVDSPRNQARVAAAIEQVQPDQDQLAETRFPLKEIAQKDLLHGEIEGSLSGGFFIVVGGISGSVYGQVDEAQQLTLVYYDNDTLIDRKAGVWRVMTFPLEKAEIVTIPAGEKPYLKYASEIRVARDRVILVVSDLPTLYLPEGWNIISVNEKY